MKFIVIQHLLTIILLSLPNSLLQQNPIRGRTETGKDILLYPDGTWKYAESTGDRTSGSNLHVKASSAKTLVKAPRGGFEIWIDESKWKQSTRPQDEPSRMTFSLKTGDGYALILAEEVGIPTPSLKEIAVENAKKAGTDFSLLAEENRKVNGREIASMKFNSTLRGIPFTYYGYYYGGKEGSIQVLCYTGQNLFDKYEKEFTEFLDGLVIPQ